MLLYIDDDGTAREYDPKLDFSIHFEDPDDLEAFEEWMLDEGSKAFTEWKKQHGFEERE